MELKDAHDPALVRWTHLASARSQVSAAELPAALEPVRATVLAFVDDHPDALHRSCVDGHLTGSAVVVDASGERALLMHHRKLGRWFQPGGHADGDANLAGVALREATEETGITGLRLAVPAVDLDVHRVAPPGETPHLHLDLRFLAIAPRQGSSEVGNEESIALRWVSPAELGDLVPPVDPSTRRLVAVGLAASQRTISGVSRARSRTSPEAASGLGPATSR